MRDVGVTSPTGRGGSWRDLIRGRAGAWLILGLFAGAAIRIALLPLPGSPDVGSWKLWAYTGSSDPAALYGVGGTPTERRLLVWNNISGTTEYPPAALYQMGMVGAIYSRLDPEFADTPALTRLIKLPGILAEIAFVAAILAWRHRLGGASAAAWIALAFWLNPAVIINGAALGYLDAQMAVPAALALVAAGTGAPALAGALMSLALLTKAQAIFLGPVVGLAVLWAGRGRLRESLFRALAGGLVVAALLVGPVIARGAWPNMIQAISRLGAHDVISGYALNVWWIVTWLVRSSYALVEMSWGEAFTMPVRILGITRLMEVGYPNPKPIGAVLVMTAIGWLIWRVRHGRPLATLALSGAWCVYTYAMFSAQVHENHAYLTVPVLAVAAGLDGRLRMLFAAVSVMTFLNMYLFYGFGEGWPPLVDRRWTGVDLTVILAFANVGLFVWFTRTTLSRHRVPPASGDPVSSGRPERPPQGVTHG